MPYEKDKSQGFKADFDDQINSGLWPDVFARRIPMWEYGENVHFTEFGVEKIHGTVEITTSGNAEPIRGILQSVEDDIINIWYGDLSNLYNWNETSGVTTTVGTGYTGRENTSGTLESTAWSFTYFGSWVLATNGKDFPQINKGAGFIDVVGMDVNSVEIFINRGPHILGFNTDCCDREFIWCDAGNPDDWIATAANLAGQLEIRELNTEIMAAVPLGTRIAVYGKDQMFLVNYLANDLVYGYQPALNGIGAVSKNAVVAVGRRNFGLSSQGFFVTDGASFEYIDDPALRHWFQGNINQAQMSKIVAYHDEEDSQIRWSIPTGVTTSNDYMVTYNYERNNWSFITGTASAFEERTVGLYAIGGNEAGEIFSIGETNDNDGVAITSYIRSKPMDLGDADSVKEIDSIRLGFRGTGLRFRVGWAENEDDTPNWEAYIETVPGFPFHNLRTAGRWLFLEFQSEDLDDAWELMTIEVIGRGEGTR